MEFIQKSLMDREIIHYYDGNLLISSQYNKVFINQIGNETNIDLPGDGILSIPGQFRLGRRALRLDKCNVVPVRDGLVIIRQGSVYHFDHNSKTLTKVLKLSNCRNILHQSMLVTENNEIYFGEYGNNASRSEVPIYRSQDSGISWQKIYSFDAGKIKHIHGCYWDKYEEKLWVFTGDFAGECYAICTDKDFTNIEWVGDGQQSYRMCNAFFEEDSIHWIMDSQLEDSFHIRMDRRTRKIEHLTKFPGPVWYIKRLVDGYYLAATAQEIGLGVKDQYAHIMATKDLNAWEDIAQYKYDGLPKRYFKFGVIGFSDGPQSSEQFYIFGEALKGLEGKSALCQVTG
ncbi:MAG TPA: hypothetical protein VJZ78_02425 [Anaerolineales bacterium]|nr:hypothetical protein [Anaerolineales bacterium]